jgi:fructose-specific phosphotransferase system IIC component
LVAFFAAFLAGALVAFFAAFLAGALVAVFAGFLAGAFLVVALDPPVADDFLAALRPVLLFAVF